MRLAKLLFTLLMICAVFGNSLECYRYMGGLAKGSCSKFELKDGKPTLFLGECDKDKYCHYLFSDKVENCSDTPPKKYPGEFCEKKEECLSNNCTKNVCNATKIESMECSSHAECDVGFYCGKKKTCVKLKDHNETCSKDEPCKVSMVCSNSKCVGRGTIKDGGEASVPEACESFYLKEKKCQEGPKLANTEKKCKDENTTCTYKYTNNETAFIRRCKCGVTEDGSSYCAPGIGDINIEPVLFVIINSTLNMSKKMVIGAIY